MQTQINNAFADLNAYMLERQTDWAMARLTNFDEQSGAIYDDRTIDSYERHDTLHAVAKGGTTYSLLVHVMASSNTSPKTLTP